MPSVESLWAFIERRARVAEFAEPVANGRRSRTIVDGKAHVAPILFASGVGQDSWAASRRYSQARLRYSPQMGQNLDLAREVPTRLA